MTRKLIAMLLCVMMIASVVTIPAFADEISYADYVPGPKPESMLTAPGTAGDSAKFQYFVDNGDPKTKLGHSWAGQYFNVNSLIEYDGTTTVGRNSYMLCGARIYDEILTTPAQMDTNYVVSFWVKNLTPEYETKVNFAPTVYKRDSISQYTKEYGEAGMTLVGEDWQEFKGTLSIGSALAGRESQPLPMFAIGLSTQSLTGTGARFSYNAEGTQKMYLAVEEAYDITNERTSASSILTTKNPATFKAQIVNQIGLPGYISQGTFTWQAFAVSDADRLEPVSGFTFTGGSDVTVTVDNTVEPGEYVIVAYNTEKGWAKGASITVDTPSPYLDYTVGDMPANLINSQTGSGASSSNLQYFYMPPTNSAFANYGSVTWPGWKHIAVKDAKDYDNGVTKAGLAGGTYLIGPYVHDKIMDPEAVTNGKKYVVSFYAKASEGKDGIVRDTKVNFMVRDFRNAANVYTSEYGTSGMDVSTDWKQFKGTFKLEAAKNPGNRSAISTLGLSADAPAGTGVTISDGLNGEPGKVYIAEEVAYDITNTITSGSATFRAGEGASFAAAVVNQIGLPGYLDQNFTWKVLDKETRKIEVEGATITAQGGVATLTTTKATVPGEYVVVAYNEENQMAKGVNITITEPNYYEDYVAGEMPENIITYVANSWNQYHQESDATVAKRSYQTTKEYMSWSVVGDYDGTTTIGKKASSNYLPGGFINSVMTSTKNGILKHAAEYDKTYVMSFNARNNTEHNAKINAAFLEWGVYNKTPAEGSSYNMQYTKEYGKGGLELVGTDWNEFKGTVKINPKNITSATNAPWLQIGFSVDCLKGTGADFRYSDLYLAEEVAYNITNTLTTGSKDMTEGSAATFKAEVVNQIGLPGYIDQDIEWRVMDKAREDDINGFEISANGSTATITVNGAAAGTYDVVAYNPENKMAKGFEITVTDAVEEVTEITVNMETAGKFTLNNVKVEDTDAQNVFVVVASYNGNKLEDASKAYAPVSDGVAELAESITINATAGNKVRVFIWDGLTPIKLANGVVAEFTR